VYQYRQIDPVNNADGGAPGGNIRVGFLFRTDRGLEFFDRPGEVTQSALAAFDIASWDLVGQELHNGVRVGVPNATRRMVPEVGYPSSSCHRFLLVKAPSPGRYRRPGLSAR